MLSGSLAENTYCILSFNQSLVVIFPFLILKTKPVVLLHRFYLIPPMLHDYLQCSWPGQWDDCRWIHWIRTGSGNLLDAGVSNLDTCPF